MTNTNEDLLVRGPAFRRWILRRCACAAPRRRRFPGALLFLLAALILPAATFGQRVYWEPGHGTLGFGKSSELSLIFDDCAPQGEVALPAIPGLDLGRPSVSQQTSISLGQTTSRVVMSYSVQPTRREPVVIPAFDVRTNRGTIAVGEVRFSVGDATVGQSGVNVSDILTGQLRPARATVWAGEVTEVDYVLLASPRFRPEIASHPDWKTDGVIAEPFETFENVEGTVGGERRIGARYRTRMVATTPGSLTLAPVRQTINVQTGERSGFIFAQPRIESFTIASDEPALTVRALPSPAPEGFTGAVGDFVLESRIVPKNARVGEPITWTVTLRGTGNWPANPTLPEREVSADFQVVQPQGRRNMDEGKLFSGSLTEDAVLVPTRAGTYTIGPVKFAWFDTTSGTFREQPIPATTVTILPTVAPTTNVPPPVDSLLPAEDDGALPRTGDETRPLPDDLRAPAPLPRDPLPSSGDALAPRKIPGAWWFALALMPPALTWLALAWQHMLRTDRHRVRASALRSITRLLDAYRRAGTSPDFAALEAWRAHTARLWNVSRATPTVDDLAAALLHTRGAARPDDWVTLWREAEAAMFGANGALPPDWITRALAASRATRLHRDAPPLPLRARHWSPALGGVALAALLLLVAGANELHASDAGAHAYREGNFAGARAAWQIEVTRHPRDPAMRNNLALACAQQNDWAAAAAHWTAAFLLQPREPSIRANLRLALTHLDGVDPELRRLVEGSWIDRAVVLLSPAEWQVLLLTGAAAIGAGFVLLITTLYSASGRRWRVVTAYFLVSLGTMVSMAGFSGARLYGPLGDPGAGLVATATELRSIPTELTEHQQTAPISAGAIVIPRREFLGWQRVDAGRIEAGWLRRETVIPFYQAPPKPAGAAAL